MEAGRKRWQRSRKEEEVKEETRTMRRRCENDAEKEGVKTKIIENACVCWVRGGEERIIIWLKTVSIRTFGPF